MLNWGLTLTEGRASQKAGASQNARSHRKQSLTEGPTLWAKARSQRRKGFTEGKAAQKPGSHRRQDLTEDLTERQGFTEDRVWPTKQRQGLTEGRGVPSLVWLQACVSQMTQCRVSHNRQGNKGFRTWRCFHPWNHTLPNCCSPLLLPHASCSCSHSFRYKLEQRAGFHTSRKAGSHRKAGLHRRQGLAH